MIKEGRWGRNMQTRAKITSKGQITVPRAVRRALGVRAGDDLVFEETENGFFVTPARSKSVLAKYRGLGNPGMASGREAGLLALRGIRGRTTEERPPHSTPMYWSHYGITTMRLIRRLSAPSTTRLDAALLSVVSFSRNCRRFPGGRGVFWTGFWPIPKSLLTG